MSAYGPGGAAIDRHLEKYLHGVKATNFDSAVPFRHGGPRPLDRIAVFDAKGDPAHWLYVSYGLSELYEKKSKRADRSGWGLELTFRLARGAEDEPPRWPLDLLQGLASVVYGARRPFEPGGQMDLNGPVSASAPTGLTAVLFAADPLLGEADSPHGRLKFVQVVPVHADELDAASAWSSAGVLGLLARRDALHATRLDRPSLLADPAAAQAIRDGVARDGSSTGSEALETLSWTADDEGVRVTIGAYAVPALKRLLIGRTAHGRPFVLEGPRTTVVVDPGDADDWRAESTALRVTLRKTTAVEISNSLEPKRGLVPLASPERLVLEVVPTEIKDPEGKVVRTIG